MAETTVSILDYIDDITVPGNVFKKPANEYWALVCMWQGMEYLYRQASHCDGIVKHRVNPHGKSTYVSLGNDPDFRGVPMALLTSAFHWYAMSAYQYVLTVGAIARRQDPSRSKPKDYVPKVIPEVLTFRDKVAAHFVWALNDNRDNDAERLASIMPPLAFRDDSFHVGAFAVTVRRAGKVSDSRAIQPWSICRVHEQLRKRYWPDQGAHEAVHNKQPNAE